MSKAQLIRALAELNVPESEYQHLSKNAELEALLKQKKAERAMKDAEASTDDSEAESEAVAAGGSSDSSPADTSEADAGETDDEPEIGVEDAPANLTKLRARTGFEVRVIDCAIVDGRPLRPR